MKNEDILSSAKIVQQLLEDLQVQRCAAVEKLLFKIQSLWPAHDLADLLPVLQELPAERIAASHRLLALQGEVQQAAGDRDAAAHSLEQARLQATADGDRVATLHITMKLARLHHLREDLGLARLYTQRVTDLLDDPSLADSELEAAMLLRVATLAPDIGLYTQGEELARRALHIYEERGDLAGACDVVFILFSFHNQTGRYQASASYLQQARHLQWTAGLGPSYQVAILNMDAHWHWYQGLLSPAFDLARQAIEVADRTDQPKQRVYNRLVAGNIARAQGDFQTAHTWYSETEQLVRQMDFTLFLPWVAVHRGWLALLQGQYGEARRLFQQALQTQDHGQRMSFHGFLAVLYHLTGRSADAVDLLLPSIAFYEQSNDPLSVCTLRLHLAANLLDLQQPAPAEQALAGALAWMAEHNIHYLPHWWHPAVMATLCAHALTHSIHASVAEQMLVQHLGEVGAAAVQPLLQHPAPTVRRRALDVLDLLAVDPLHCLGPALDPRVRGVLAEALGGGLLLAKALPELAARLTTAEQHHQPNPTLVALFALYVHGATREEIAQKLGLSDAAVRNYVNHLYKEFDLPYDSARRAERRQQLYTLARAAGYVPERPQT